MRVPRAGSRAAVAALVAVMLAGSVAAAVVTARAPEARASMNVERFATLSFGGLRAGDHALAARAFLAPGARGQDRGADAGRGHQGQATGNQAGSPDVCSGRAPTTDIPPVAVTQYRTPNGWCLRPAGTQIDTPRAPTGVAVSRDARTVYVVNSGIFDEQLELIDASTLTRTLAPATDLYMGVAQDDQGNLWASGGSRNRVWQFKQVGPVAAGTRHVGLFPGSPNNGLPAVGYPGNLAVGLGRLFVAGNLSVPLDTVTGGARQCGGGRKICSVLNVYDLSAVGDGVSQQSPWLVPVGRDAYGVALNAPAARLYVTNWADETDPTRAAGSGTVSVLDVSTPGSEREVNVVPVGRHPTGIALSPDRTRLVVTNSEDDTISVLGLDAAGNVTGATTQSVRTTPTAKLGATPLAATYSPDGSRLFVALAGQNTVEVRNPDGTAIPRTVRVTTSEGVPETVTVPHTYIPVAWYPSALASAPNPSDPNKPPRLYVTNLKGIGAGPGLNGQAEPLNGARTQGTISAIDVDPTNLDRWTAAVLENNRWQPLFDGTRDAAADPCKPAPLPDGGTAFSQLLCDASTGAVDPRQFHVIDIVKENKTFDQYFGDIRALGVPDADADPTWLLYGYPVTTNQHELAKRFTLSDRFWADAEQSTTGHQWESAGYVTEYDEITWNTEYDQGLRGGRWAGQYDGQLAGTKSDPDVAAQEGRMDAPPSRLADAVLNAGYSVRVYSDDLNNDSPARAWQVPLGMWGIGPSAVHRGRDLDFPDTDRVNIFLHGQTVSNAWSIDKGAPPPTFGKTISLSDADKQKFTLDAWTQQYRQCTTNGGSDAQCQQAMPNFLYMALPVDHTLGFNPLEPTPASMVADNDEALGRLVDALSKSPFWKNTLIFVTEDDTQFAGDHVDAHRTFLLTAGGLARTLGAQGRASHQDGSFPALLKTVEVLYRVPPLSIYDQLAVPLHDVVVSSPADANTVRYDAVKPPTPFLRNPNDGSPLALLSQQMSWRLDQNDPKLLQDLLYAGIRGWPLPQEDLARLKR